MLEYGILLPFAMQLKKLYGKACRDVCVKYELTQTEFDILDFLGERSGLDTAGEIARRRLDFLSGVAYANEGKIKKVAASTYLITPINVEIVGDLVEELENSGMYL